MNIRIIWFLFLICYVGISLANSTTQIPDVIVREPNKKIASATAQKTLITQQDLQTRGVTSLSQALQTLGGVQLQDTSSNGSQVLLSMRGFGANASSNTLLLINGIPLTNPDIAPPDLNAIPLQEIEYVEIFAGSESVLYGDQAVGGTINIVTSRKLKKEAYLTCGLGSYQQTNCFASFNNHYRQFNYAMSFLTNHTDNYRQHNAYDQNRLNGRLGYQYSTGSIALDFQLAKENMLYPGALSKAEVEQDRRQSNNNTDFFNDWTGYFHLRQEQALGLNWNLETDFVRRDMHGEGVLFSPFTQSRMIYLFMQQLKGNIGKAAMTSGVEVESDRYHLGTQFGITDDALQKYGLFSLVNYPIAEKWLLSFGARGALQQSALMQSPTTLKTTNRAHAETIGVTYAISPNLNMYLRRAGSFRFPKADEIASASPITAGLKTQQGIAYETGIQWMWKRLMTKLSLYQLNLVDEITFDPTQTPEDPFGTNRNLPPTVRYGFSLSEKYAFTEWLTLNAQYHFVNARFQSGVNAGKRIPLVSDNIFQAGLDYAFLENWNIYAEAIYTGNQFAANDDANIAPKVPGFAIYNASLRFQHKQLVVALRLNNVFNQFYNVYSIFDQMSETESFYPAPGRNFLLTLRYSFE